jgi:hypothetical protein
VNAWAAKAEFQTILETVELFHRLGDEIEIRIHEVARPAGL